MAALIIAFCNGACSCTRGQIARPYPAPSAQGILADLAAVRDRAHSFKIDSKMDYWVGDDRIKGTVLLMGRSGAYLRINALSPTGDNVAADLACDGMGFKYIDYNNNCQLTGPCNRESVAQLLRISLEPDDFLLLVIGTTPLIASTQATLSWDDKNGHEVVTLTARDTGLTQAIVLDGRHCERGPDASQCQWDVLSSVVRDSGGTEQWNLKNKDFYPVRAEDGATFRVPKKTHFKQPTEKADLLIRWHEHILNATIENDKFTMAIPAGLRSC